MNILEIRKMFPQTEGMTDFDVADLWAKGNNISPELARYKLGIDQPDAPGFKSSLDASLGHAVRGAGRGLRDMGLTGIGQSVERYGKDVVQSNPESVQGFQQFAESPWQGFKEAAGSAIGSSGLGMAAQAGAAGLSLIPHPLAQAGAWALRAGGLASMFAPEYGSIREKQDQNGIADNPGSIPAAIAGAGVNTAIETVAGPQAMMRRLIGQGLSADTARAMVREFAKSPMKTVGKEVLRNSAGEAGEELLQNPIGDWAGGDDPFAAKNLGETAFGAFKAGVGTLPFGGFAGARAGLAQSRLGNQLRQGGFLEGNSNAPTDLLAGLENRDYQTYLAPMHEQANQFNRWADNPLGALQDVGGFVQSEPDTQAFINQQMGVRGTGGTVAGIKTSPEGDKSLIRTPFTAAETKQHKKTQSEYDKMFKAPSGVFVANPDTGVEEELTLGDWYNLQDMPVSRMKGKESANTLPPLETLGEAISLLQLAHNMAVPVGPGKSQFPVRAEGEQGIKLKDGTVLATDSPLYQRILEAQEIIKNQAPVGLRWAGTPGFGTPMVDSPEYNRMLGENADIGNRRAGEVGFGDLINNLLAQRDSVKAKPAVKAKTTAKAAAPQPKAVTPVGKAREAFIASGGKLNTWEKFLSKSGLKRDATAEQIHAEMEKKTLNGQASSAWHLALEKLTGGKRDSSSVREGVRADGQKDQGTQSVQEVRTETAKAGQGANAEDNQGEVDPQKYDEARRFVAREKIVGAVKLQRQLAISFKEAEAILARLQTDGRIGSANTDGVHQVLKNKKNQIAQDKSELVGEDATKDKPYVGPVKPKGADDLPRYQKAMKTWVAGNVNSDQLTALDMISRADKDNAGDTASAASSLRAAAKSLGVSYETVRTRAKKALARIQMMADLHGIDTDTMMETLGYQSSYDLLDTNAESAFEGNKRTVVHKDDEEFDDTAGTERAETGDIKEGKDGTEEAGYTTEEDTAATEDEAAAVADGGDKTSVRMQESNLDHTGTPIKQVDIDDAIETWGVLADKFKGIPALPEKYLLRWTKIYIRALDMGDVDGNRYNNEFLTLAGEIEADTNPGKDAGVSGRSADQEKSADSRAEEGTSGASGEASTKQSPPPVVTTKTRKRVVKPSAEENLATKAAALYDAYAASKNLASKYSDLNESQQFSVRGVADRDVSAQENVFNSILREVDAKPVAQETTIRRGNNALAAALKGAGVAPAEEQETAAEEQGGADQDSDVGLKATVVNTDIQTLVGQLRNFEAQLRALREAGLSDRTKDVKKLLGNIAGAKTQLLAASPYQVITQEDSPDTFPEGMKFAVDHGTQGTLDYFGTRAEAENYAVGEVILASEAESNKTSTAVSTRKQEEAGNTYEGEFEVVSNDVATATTTVPLLTNVATKTLTKEEKAEVAAAYGAPRWTAKVAERFHGEFADWLAKGSDAAHKLAKIFARYAKAVVNTIAGIAVAMHLSVGNIPDVHAAKVPLSKFQITRTIKNPKADFNGVVASNDVRVVADWQLRKDEGKPFIIAEKPTGLLYAFDADGKLLAKTPAIYGASVGDMLVPGSEDKTVEETLPNEKVTPAGEFDSEGALAYGAPGVDFVKQSKSTIAIHTVYLGTPSERRMARLQSETGADNRVSYGCINVLPEFAEQVLGVHFNGRSKVVVLPETEQVEKFFPEIASYPDETTTTETVEVGGDSTNKAAAVSWGNDKYADGRKRGTQTSGPRGRVRDRRTKEWSGEDNVVADEDGQPIPVYHGNQSREDFDKFDRKKGLAEKIATAIGTHFSLVPAIANTFTVSNKARYMTYSPNGYAWGRRMVDEYNGDGGNVRQSYIRLKNPLDLRGYQAERNMEDDDVAVARYVLKAAMTPEYMHALLNNSGFNFTLEGATTVLNRLKAGQKTSFGGQSYSSLDEFVDDRAYASLGGTNADKIVAQVVDKFVRDSGYDGIIYTNTSPVETREAVDKTCYIVFDGDNVTSALSPEPVKRELPNASENKSAASVTDAPISRAKLIEKIKFEIKQFKELIANYKTLLPEAQKGNPEAKGTFTGRFYKNYTKRQQVEVIREKIPEFEKEIAALNERLKHLEHTKNNPSDVYRPAIVAIENGDYNKAIDAQVAAGVIPASEAPLYRFVANNDTKGALKWIASNARSRAARLTAKFLFAANINPVIGFGSIDSAGSHQAYSDTTTVDPRRYLTPNEFAGRFTDFVDTVVHEVVHSATIAKLSRAFDILTRDPNSENLIRALTATNRRSDVAFIPSFFYTTNIGNTRSESLPLGDLAYMKTREFKAAKQIFELFAHLRNYHGDVFNKELHYGATDPLELVAEIFTNRRLQVALSTIELPTKFTGSNAVTRTWNWFLDALRTLLGITRVPNSALDEVMAATAGLVSRRDSSNGYAPLTFRENRGLYKLQHLFNKSTIAREKSTGDSFDAAAAPVIKDTKSLMAEWIGTTAKHFGMGMMFGHDFAKLAEKTIKPVGKYFRTMEERYWEREQAEQRIANIMADVMDQLTIPQRDQLNKFLSMSQYEFMGKYYEQPKWLKETIVPDTKFAAEFAKLNPQQQAIANRIFEEGEKSYYALEDAMRDADPDTRIPRTKLKGLYTPLKRTGEYAAVAKSAVFAQQEAWANEGDAKARKWVKEHEADPNHKWVSFHDTRWEAMKKREELLARNPQFSREHSTASALEVDDQLINEMGFQTYKRLEEMIGASTLGDKAKRSALQSMARQLYVASLNRMHAQHSNQTRRRIAGADEDMLHAFATQGKANAALLASVKTTPALQEALQESRGAARGSEQGKEIVNELLRRHIAMSAYKETPFQDKFTKLSSVYFLLTSPAYFLTNMTQPFMMSTPVLTQFGSAKAIDAMTTAWGQTVKSIKFFKRNAISLDDIKNLKGAVGREVDAMQEMMRRNQLTVGMSLEMGDFDKPGMLGPHADAALQKIQTIARNAELVNRLSTALAAYRLAYQDAIAAGAKPDAAHIKAQDFTYKVLIDTHGDYSGYNAPRYFMQGTSALPIKVMTQFRKFSLIQLALIAKLGKQAFFGANAKEKAAGRVMLGWLMGTSLALAGTMGTLGGPLVVKLIAMMFGDDGEDKEEAIRRLIGNRHVADLLLKGVPGMIGLDLSKRVGNAQILDPLSTVPDSKSAKEAIINTVFSAVTGASGSLALRFGDGLIDIFDKGEYWKGLEKLVPKGVTDVSKALRFQVEGVTNGRDDVLYKPEDVKLIDSAFQAVGLPTMHLTERTRKAGVMIETKQRFTDEAADIKRAYVEAYDAKDSDGKLKAMAEWRKLQSEKKALGIATEPVATLLKAPKEQDKREKATVGGLQYTKSYKGFAERLSAS